MRCWGRSRRRLVDECRMQNEECGMMRRVILLSAFFVLHSAFAHAQPALFEPSLSPDAKTVVFVSGGDIWSAPSSGGAAHLLVAHPATESRPLFSPDGKSLAFISNRTGNGDIY